MKEYSLINWDKKTECYRWSTNLRLRKSGLKSKTDGFYKKFSFGGSILTYRENENWIVCVKNRCFSSNEIEDLELRVLGIILILSFCHQGKTYQFYDWSIWDSFSRYIDPTYDQLDAEYEFANWFYTTNAR